MPRYEKANSHTRVPPYPKKVLPGNLPWGFPDGSDGKEFACHAGHRGSIPGWGRSPWRREWKSFLSRDAITSGHVCQVIRRDDAETLTDAADLGGSWGESLAGPPHCWGCCLNKRCSAT